MSIRFPTLMATGTQRLAKGRRRLGRLGGVILALLLVVGGSLVVRWYLAKRSLAWQVRRGLELLEGADTPAKVWSALDRWETETRADWEPRREEVITHLFSRQPLEDRRVRLLLARVAGADYGSRQEDWRRWYDTRCRLRDGLPPKVSRREAVVLEPSWVAPVGLTAWFTTILPLDGQVYVASLGADFNDPQDEADGVVRVDGRSGAAELLFIPPAEHCGPRDVIGLAAGDDGLLVACHNGSVSCIDADGKPRWHAHVGDPIIGPPLAADANQDGVTDVMVPTRAGRVVALNGRQGRTMWVASVARPPTGHTMLGATLSLGDVLPGAEPELVVSMPAGEVAVLSARSGQVLWRHELAAGTLAGALCRTGAWRAGPPAYLGDRGASIWSLVSSGTSLEAVRWQALALRRDETLVAALRGLGLQEEGGEQLPLGGQLLVACPTGDYGGQRGAVSGLAPEGERWRLPIDGAVWGTPAVADLNADGHPEIVVASIEPRADGGLAGVVTIVSGSGHCLARLVLPAPIECSPVVADVDGDSRLEVLVADQSGRLHCLRTGGYGPVEWGTLGGDSHNTRNAANAYAYGQVPFGYQSRWRPK